MAPIMPDNLKWGVPDITALGSPLRADYYRNSPLVRHYPTLKS